MVCYVLYNKEWVVTFGTVKTRLGMVQTRSWSFQDNSFVEHFLTVLDLRADEGNDSKIKTGRVFQPGGVPHKSLEEMVQNLSRCGRDL